jgi:hypothetical protein
VSEADECFPRDQISLVVVYVLVTSVFFFRHDSFVTVPFRKIALAHPFFGRLVSASHGYSTHNSGVPAWEEGDEVSRRIFESGKTARNVPMGHVP